MTTARASTTALTWVHRLTVVSLVASVPLCADHLDLFDDRVAVAYTATLWLTWGAMLLCVMVPASTSLTAVRIASASHLTTLAVLALGHAGDAAPYIALALAAACAIVAFTAEVGNEYVQGSAYGAERRFLLKPPPAQVAVQIVMFAVWYSFTFAAIALLVSGSWAAGIVIAVMAIACGVLLPTRFHRFSRRWLVSVPAGLVVHDHLVLAETAMFTHADVRSVEVLDTSPDSSGAADAPADLTGGPDARAPRSGVVITLADFDTVVLAAMRRGDAPRPIHVRSFVVQPSRVATTVAALTRGD